MYKWRRIAAAAACAAALAASGCGAGDGGGGDSGDAGDDTVKVAIMASTVGPLSYYGNQAIRGWEMALDNHGAEIPGTDKKIEYIKVLCQTPAECTRATTKVVREQGAEIIMGFPGSALALPISQQAARLKVPYMEAASTVKSLVPDEPMESIFRASAHDGAFAGDTMRLALEGMLDKLGKEPEDVTAMVVNESGAANHDQSLVEVALLEDMGIRNLGRLEYTADTTDFGPIAAKLKANDPDILINASYEPDAIGLTTAMTRAGFNPPIHISSATGNSDTLRDAVGAKNVNGNLATFYPDFSSDPEGAPGVEEFLDTYEEKYGERPPTAHPLVYYSSAMILFKVLEEAQGSSSLEDIQAAVASIDEPNGTFPNGWGAKFDETGENERAFTSVLQWQDGKICTVAPEELATCDFKTVEEAGG